MSRYERDGDEWFDGIDYDEPVPEVAICAACGCEAVASEMSVTTLGDAACEWCSRGMQVMGDGWEADDAERA